MSESRRKYWSKLISEQEASGESVRQFCRGRGVGEHSFYQWRKRLRDQAPVRFALLETRQRDGNEPVLELELTSGERLRIGRGVDPTTLRIVLEAVRA